jgi:hypothetical protein
MTSPLYRQLTPSAPAANNLFDFTASAADVFPPRHPTRKLLARTWCDVALDFADYNEHYGTLTIAAAGLGARLAVTDESTALTLCVMLAREDTRVTAFESGGALVLLAIAESHRCMLRVHSAVLWSNA